MHQARAANNMESASRGLEQPGGENLCINKEDNVQKNPHDIHKK